MNADKANMIRLLEMELDYIEGGGYGKPAGKPQEEKPIFYHSPACINSWKVPGHEAECHDDCVLLDAVPHEHRNQGLPCHFIPLNAEGDTLQSLEGRVDQDEVEEAVKKWLRNAIEQLKADAPAETEGGVDY